MAKNKLPKIEELFTDPKHSELADWFKGIFKHILKEMSEERKKKQKLKPDKKSFDLLGSIFGTDDDDNSNDDDDDNTEDDE